MRAEHKLTQAKKAKKQGEVDERLPVGTNTELLGAKSQRRRPEQAWLC